MEFFETGHIELYHLGEDVGENREVNDRHPAVAERLHARLRDWQASVGARFPTENPSYEPWPERAEPTEDR